MQEHAGGALGSWIIVIPLVVLFAVGTVLAGGPRDLAYLIQDTCSQVFSSVYQWVSRL